MTYKIRGTSKTVTLDKNNFKAKGGEGSIHVIGDTVYKVCDPGKMIADGKFNELAVLDHPRIIRPEDIILERNQAVGYTMRLVPNAQPLARILTKTYREREGITPDTMSKLVQQIADGLRFIHQHTGYLQVDGNELNYMVTNTYEDLYFIDVNSYQTPHFPADAIMASIRDWQAGTNFSELTDWYSFAIISWYMFTGIHPFKQRHPSFPDMKTAMIDQMKAGVSILDKESAFPQAAVYFPFEQVIPGGANGAFMQWYNAIFLDNKRLPAPKNYQATIAFVVKVKEIIGSNNFEIHMLRQFTAQIISYYEKDGKDVVVTTDNLYANNQPVSKPAQKFRIGFTNSTKIPVALIHENGRVKVLNLETQNYLPHSTNPFEMAADNIMAYDGRLYIHMGQHVYELTFIENDNGIITTLTKSVATVMPHATQFFQGVAIQDMLGACMASVFPETGHHRQIKLIELQGYQIIEAKYESKVLMVIGLDKDGQYTRFVFRIAKDWQSYDMRQIENIVPQGLNFTVLDNGVAVCLTEEEKIEIFLAVPNGQIMKSISDPAIKANMRLCHAGSQVRAAHGDKLYSLAVKK